MGEEGGRGRKLRGRPRNEAPLLSLFLSWSFQDIFAQPPRRGLVASYFVSFSLSRLKISQGDR